MFTVKKDKTKEFIENSNKHKISNNFLKECEKASKLFKTQRLLTIKDMIDNVLVSNTIIAIYEDYKKDNNCSKMLWRGMSWNLPEKYKDRHGKIFGSTAENIYKSDTVNIILID